MTQPMLRLQCQWCSFHAQDTGDTILEVTKFLHGVLREHFEDCHPGMPMRGYLLTGPEIVSDALSEAIQRAWHTACAPVKA